MQTSKVGLKVKLRCDRHYACSGMIENQHVVGLFHGMGLPDDWWDVVGCGHVHSQDVYLCRYKRDGNQLYTTVNEDGLEALEFNFKE